MTIWGDDVGRAQMLRDEKRTSDRKEEIVVRLVK